MRFTLTAAAVGTFLLATPALAWSEYENHTQPASDTMLIYAYKGAPNYCPTGLQPVVIGGVVCCGVPNTHEYQSHPAPRRSTYHKPVVVYEKGQ